MKVAFLDRDGVINKEVNYLYRIDEFTYTSKCIEGLKILRDLDFEIIIVTNQAGIAKGIFSEDEHKTLLTWLLNDLSNKGIKILEYIFCPHHLNGVVQKFKIDCNCRKPKPGMLESAKNNYSINMKDSILIGDKITDIKAAISAGVGAYYLVESGHKLSVDDRLVAPVYSNLYNVAKLLNQAKKD